MDAKSSVLFLSLSLILVFVVVVVAAAVVVVVAAAVVADVATVAADAVQAVVAVHAVAAAFRREPLRGWQSQLAGSLSTQFLERIQAHRFQRAITINHIYISADRHTRTSTLHILQSSPILALFSSFTYDFGHVKVYFGNDLAINSRNPL